MKTRKLGNQGLEIPWIGLAVWYICTVPIRKCPLKTPSVQDIAATDIVLTDDDMNRNETIIPLGTDTGDRNIWQSF